MIMAEKTIRTHVVLPKELVEEVDELVGQRKRSAYIAEAVEAKVAHDRFGKALKESVGILSAEDYPEWETPERISAWVRELRNEADEGTERKLSRIRQP
jgi:metal-responsive CopG/Arc/MetJ family transcriptional regulator